MARQVLDWVFGNQVANADGTMPAIVRGTTAVAGPGATALGERTTALAFGAGAGCQVQLSPGSVDATRFAIRVAFRVTAPVTTRGNLIESTALPCAMIVEPGATAQRFNVVGFVANGTTGWTSAGSANRVALEVGRWYVASIVYARDTLALLIEDEVVAVTAFPRGGLQAPTGDQLFVGTWVDGARWPFGGEIAGVQLWHDIPEPLEAKLDAERNTPEWQLTRKENAVRPGLNLGPRTGDFYFDPATSSYLQPFALATISYTEGHGTAFVIYGSILAKWRSDENLRRELGALASDEIAGRAAGSRKSVFAGGCIYWSPATGAFPVTGRMYLDFEMLGEGASAIGLPAADPETISGGRTQRFAGGRMYHRTGASNAFEVHGSILAKYLATGGPGQWGFPISHELDVRRGTAAIGKQSEFESCTILWSPATPASIIYGAIRDTYRTNGGPGGDLGFPTSDEAAIPGAAGFARYNTFQRGSILFFDGRSIVCRPFRFWLGRLDTKEEDRDIFDFDGQNDLYCRVCVDVNGGRVFDRKIPDGAGHYPSANILDLAYQVPYEIVPNAANLSVRLRVEVWESDAGQIFGGGDAPCGTFTKELTMANAWGLLENGAGVFRAGNFGPWINSLDWAIKPSVGPNTPLDNFGVTNRGTPQIAWREYAAAFGDVDPDFEIDFGIIDDGLKALYYELVVKGVASSGNCFGMATEAIYAHKDLSRLGRPLARFTNWGDVEDDFNVRHAYQVGADAIWWFVGQFLSGNTHNPVGVFQATWDAFTRGLNPVICVAQNYDFSGAPHCIFPVAWNRDVTPWQITCFDSNRQNNRTTIFIDPARNWFTYDAGSHYEGGEWNGGRLHYMPWSVLNHRQRTPVWDAILLLLSGVIVLFGDTVDVAALGDDKGNDLDASKVTNRSALAGKLLRVPGISGAGPVRGSMFVGRQPPANLALPPRIIRDVLGTAVTPTVRADLPRLVTRHTLAQPVATRTPIASDAPIGALSGPALAAIVRSGGLAALRRDQVTGLSTIRASLTGRSAGKLDSYVKRALHGVRVQGDVAVGEKVALGQERAGARDQEITVHSDRARAYDITIASKLGAGKDFLRVKLEGLPTDPGRAARINPQPAAGGFDVIALGAPADTRVIIDGMSDGKPVRSEFGVRMEGGMRMTLPDLADPAVLEVGAIDALLGAVRNVKVIRRR